MLGGRQLKKLCNGIRPLSSGPYYPHNMKRFHLQPVGDRWALTRDGGTGQFLYDDKEQAAEDARLAMSERAGSLKIHRTDGSVEEERAYPSSLDSALRSPVRH
jgi:hypothetical protein